MVTVRRTPASNIAIARPPVTAVVPAALTRGAAWSHPPEPPPQRCQHRPGHAPVLIGWLWGGQARDGHHLVHAQFDPLPAGHDIACAARSASRSR